MQEDKDVQPGSWERCVREPKRGYRLRIVFVLEEDPLTDSIFTLIIRFIEDVTAEHTSAANKVCPSKSTFQPYITHGKALYTLHWRLNKCCKNVRVGNMLILEQEEKYYGLSLNSRQVDEIPGGRLAE